MEKQSIGNHQISKNELSKKKSLQEKGITLIALVVTIIILLILAGVTLNMALSQNGLFSKTQEAADKYKKAQKDEELEIEKIEYAAEGKDIKEVEKISDKEGFEDFRKRVNEGENFENTLVKLYCDVDLENEDWTPIGTTTNPFKGVFNGNGHTVTNLKLVKAEQTKNQYGNYFTGLFGINEGIIKNVGIESGSISDSLDEKCSIGMIAGQNFGKIERCYNEADMTCTSSLYGLGGIVGDLRDSGSVIKCYNTGDFTLGSNGKNCHLAGGIVANCGNNNGEGVFQCYNLGNLTCKDSSNNGSIIGGICGSGRYNIFSCYNRGEIVVDKSGDGVFDKEYNLGGIVGIEPTDSITNLVIMNCYNGGSVEFDTVSDGVIKRKGSIIGLVYRDSTKIINNFCYNIENLNGIGEDKSSGDSKNREINILDNVEDLKKIAEQLGSDFKEDKSGKINEGFPILTWQDE